MVVDDADQSSLSFFPLLLIMLYEALQIFKLHVKFLQYKHLNILF